MRNYVRYFFGCRDCADHFEQMAAASMHKVGSPSSAVLWLWTSHNRVNARLSGKERLLPRLEVGGGSILIVSSVTPYASHTDLLSLLTSPVPLAPCVEETDWDTVGPQW